jgi:hypothetical protein
MISESIEKSIFTIKYDQNRPLMFSLAFAFVQQVTAACVALTTDDAILSWASTYAFVEAGAHARLIPPAFSRS